MKKILYIISFTFIFFSLKAEEKKNFWGNVKDYTRGIITSANVGIEYRIKGGIALGGTSPLPLPAEIREIKGFNPKLNLSLEGEISKMFTDDWFLLFGLRLESKAMTTTAGVKGYNITMVSDNDGSISGVFTGTVETTVNNSYLTLPVLAMWKPHDRWGIKLGAYGSCALGRHFSGSAYDGYLREGDPTGEYIYITSATYDFSSNLRRLAWGVQAGAEWRAFSHLLISVDLMWGMNSIFKSDFDVIKFDMYPIYGALSFGYAF